MVTNFLVVVSDGWMNDHKVHDYASLFFFSNCKILPTVPTEGARAETHYPLLNFWNF